MSADLIAFPDDLTLAHGKHDSRDDGVCAMEAVAWLAGEPHSDHPACTSPVIAAFLRHWNDDLPDDETRTRLLVPLLPAVVGTRTTTADDEARAWLATDWLVRECAPAWLRLSGLTDHAERLEGLEAVVSPDAARAGQEHTTAARAAARAAVEGAAWSAAWNAARYAAGDAAGAVVWDAAGSAAWSAAWNAAGAAAWDAAWDALTPTITDLQVSAQGLVRRMCAIGREGEADA